RVVIEQAKGMVAERLGVNMEQAFSTLRNHARNHNLLLVGIAGDVIHGTLSASALDLVHRNHPKNKIVGASMTFQETVATASSRARRASRSGVSVVFTKSFSLQPCWSSSSTCHSPGPPSSSSRAA
ncbi:MAG: ANTAR domain-containing protein, partial [Gaiellaceae bacterium]